MFPLRRAVVASVASVASGVPGVVLEADPSACTAAALDDRFEARQEGPLIVNIYSKRDGIGKVR